MIIADFCFSRILQVQTLCVCVCQPKNCRKILEFWLIVNLETKKVPLLALGLSRRPGSASQLRLAPPKRRIVTKMEQEPVGASWCKSSSEIFHIFIHWNKCLSWIPLLSISLIIHLQSDSHWSVAQYFDVQSVQLYALARGKCGTILVAAVVLSHIQNLAIGLNILSTFLSTFLSTLVKEYFFEYYFEYSKKYSRVSSSYLKNKHQHQGGKSAWWWDPVDNCGGGGPFVPYVPYVECHM